MLLTHVLRSVSSCWLLFPFLPLGRRRGRWEGGPSMQPCGAVVTFICYGTSIYHSQHWTFFTASTACMCTALRAGIVAVAAHLSYFVAQDRQGPRRELVCVSCSISAVVGQLALTCRIVDNR